jgi:hypothetical protein
VAPAAVGAVVCGGVRPWTRGASVMRIMAVNTRIDLMDASYRWIL